MKLADLIAEVDQLRPNQFDANIKTGWLNEIESKAIADVFNRAVGNSYIFIPYDYAEDSERELMIPDVHKDVYTSYLYAKIDFTQNEIDRYNADSIVHAGAWNDFAARYRREHLPK